MKNEYMKIVAIFAVIIAAVLLFSVMGIAVFLLPLLGGGLMK